MKTDKQLNYKPGLMINSQKEDRVRWREEVLGLAFLAAFLLICGSLISFSPEDPSLNTTSTNPHVKNLIGYFGAYLADFLFSILGGGAYLIPLAFFINGWRWLSGRSHSISFSSIAGFIILLCALPALLTLHFHRMPLSINGDVTAGGLIGSVVVSLLTDCCATFGAHVVTITAFIISTILTTGLSVTKTLTSVRSTFLKLAKAGRGYIASRQEKRKGEVKTRQRMEPLQSPEIVSPSETDKAPIPRQEPLPFKDTVVDGTYGLPPVSLLNDPQPSSNRISKEILLMNSSILEKKLLDFGVEGQIVQVHPGPLITMYEFGPAPNVKLSRIVNLSDDLALAMKSGSVRIVAPIPGKSTIGIEVPNPERENVYLKEIIASEQFRMSKFKIPLAFGKDISGNPVVADLTKMPHLLVAGATGSGKSIFLNSIIASFLLSKTPSELKLVMIDPKILELSAYEGIPHLLTPVITQPRDASIVLRRLVGEMQKRYTILAEKGVRNIESYNNMVLREEIMPYIVIILDELADLMMTAQREVEDSIARLAQMARAAGIHLILATQRPSVDVLTGVIKANFPARVSFKVSSRIDSRTILDAGGAENLLDRGDMLFLQPGTYKLLRIHGAFISEGEIKRLVDHIKSQGQPEYDHTLQLKEDSPSESGEERDEIYRQALDLVLSTGQASISMIQRRLRIGFNRAARLVEMMEEDGYVGPSVAGKPREVLKRKDKE